MAAALLVVPVAYLLGSIPTGVLLSRGLSGIDVREYGSGNIGASNVARTSGFRIGALVAIVDILKGVAAVMLGRLLDLPPDALAAVAIAAVLGHDYSLYLGFRGGKGVATTLGASLALAPTAAVLAALTWLITLALFRFTSLASLVALFLLPAFLAARGAPHGYVVAAVVLCLLAVWKHRGNLVRLAGGRERRFGESSRPHGG